MEARTPCECGEPRTQDDSLLLVVPLVTALCPKKAFLQVFQSSVTKAAMIILSCLLYADNFVEGSHFLAP